MERRSLYDSANALRAYLLKTMEGLSAEQLTKVPEGFRNNILWNLGHVAWAQGLFIWETCGHDAPVPKHFHDLFKNGSSPADWSSAPDEAEVASVLSALNEKALEADISGKLANRKPYDLHGLFIETTEDAIAFNLWHEGIHLGTIMALKRFV